MYILGCLRVKLNAKPVNYDWYFQDLSDWFPRVKLNAMIKTGPILPVISGHNQAIWHMVAVLIPDGLI